MSINGALARLEARSLKTLRCAWCRFSLVTSPVPEPKRGEVDLSCREEFICDFCGTKYGVNMSGLSEYERELIRLQRVPNALEKYFQDERVHAACEWTSAHSVVARWREGKLTTEVLAARRVVVRGVKAVKLSGDALRRAELKDRAYKFIARKRGEAEAKYRSVEIPLAVEIAAIHEKSLVHIIGEGLPEKLARLVLARALVMAACESVVWGKVLPETQEVVDSQTVAVAQCDAERSERERVEAEGRAARDAEYERVKSGFRPASPVVPDAAPVIVAEPIRPQPIFLADAPVRRPPGYGSECDAIHPSVRMRESDVY